MPQTTPNPTLRCADRLCGVEFTPRTAWQKYHSARCRKRHWERTRGRGHQPVAALTCPHCAALLSLVLAPAC
ncbi:MAG: hypothetical protein V3R29_01245, partial [Candidatus Acidoferrales bacterium]